MPDETRLITAGDLADRWGCSRQHVYNLLHRGLPSLKLGRSRRFRVADAEAWLEAQQGGGANAVA